jgi:hypothetical protein
MNCELPCKIRLNCIYYIEDICPNYYNENFGKNSKHIHKKQAYHYRQKQLKKKYLSNW